MRWTNFVDELEDPKIDKEGRRGMPAIALLIVARTLFKKQHLLLLSSWGLCQLYKQRPFALSFKKGTERLATVQERLSATLAQVLLELPQPLKEPVSF
jgi:hypothetical protein